LNLLLDTHAVLWWFNGDRSLSPAARAAIEQAENDIFVSAVSAMEITTKHRLGKLPEADGLVVNFGDMISHEAFTPLAISLAHGLLAGRLAIGHKDPFDRLLIAQSLLEDLPLVSNETLFDAAGVKRVW
jgi:PIN domain nuclease of toxin-antitoxin system